MLYGAALMLALSSALPHGVARAHGPPAPALNWVRLPGAEHCIAAAALADRIEERVGRVLFVPDTEAGLSVDGRVGRNEQGFQVTLQVSKPGGRVLGERVPHSKRFRVATRHEQHDHAAPHAPRQLRQSAGELAAVRAVR